MPVVTRIWVCAAFLMAAPVSKVVAQESRVEATTSPEQLTLASRKMVVDSVATLLERLYPAPDTGRIIATHLRMQQGRGLFDGAGDTDSFAMALTREMRAINGDKHLSVRGTGAGSGRRMMRRDPGQERGSNYGIAPPEVLDGNVGYLRIGVLFGAQEAIERLGVALRMLENTDAVIIDLRGAPGGTPAMANAIISHFTEPDRPSLRVYDRTTGETYVRRTTATVPGPRRTKVPLYVLVDGRSASAAEDVPFVLQNFRRATIVGERTAGAGRNNTVVPVGAGLVASISYSRVQDPATGREWEGTGVQPDVQAASADALEAARRHAVERLSARSR